VAILETPSGLPPKAVSALRRLRLASVPEAISWLILIVCSIAKNATDVGWGEGSVKVMGPIHGGLFILYVIFWLDAWNRNKWEKGRGALYFVLSIVPSGGFFADRMLRREEEAGVIAARARKEQTGKVSTGGAGGGVASS
jgi:integral membrane protein